MRKKSNSKHSCKKTLPCVPQEQLPPEGRKGNSHGCINLNCTVIQTKALYKYVMCLAGGVWRMVLIDVLPIQQTADSDIYLRKYLHAFAEHTHFQG